MKILYVSNQGLNKELDSKYLEPFGDFEDIFLIDSTDNAIKYLTENVIQKQSHLDFVVVDFINLENEERDRLAIWLRINSSSYSLENFQLSSVPIILIKEWEFLRHGYSNPFYNNIIYRDFSDKTKIEFIGNA